MRQSNLEPSTGLLYRLGDLRSYCAFCPEHSSQFQVREMLQRVECLSGLASRVCPTEVHQHSLRWASDGPALRAILPVGVMQKRIARPKEHDRSVVNQVYVSAG